MGEVWKDAVVGWLVVYRSGFPAGSLTVLPVSVDWEGDEQVGYGPDDEKLVVEALESGGSVWLLPAQPGTTLVYCCPGEGASCFVLGVEIPGANNPDWAAECRVRAGKLPRTPNKGRDMGVVS